MSASNSVGRDSALFLELLNKKDSKRWNDINYKNADDGQGDFYMDLREIDISKQCLTDYDFRFVTFNRSNITGATLNKGRFYFVSMAGASCCDTTYKDCFFTRLGTKNTVFDNAHFEKCAFTGGNSFEATSFKNTTFKECSFKIRKWAYVGEAETINICKSADFTDAKFLNCDLSDLAISKEQLKQCASIEGSILPQKLEAMRNEIEEEIVRRQRKAEHMRPDEPPPAPETITDRIHNYESPLVPYLDTATKWGEAEGKPTRYRFMLADALKQVREDFTITGRHNYADAVFASFAQRVLLDAGLAGRADREVLEQRVIFALVSGLPSPGLEKPGVEVEVDPVKTRSSPTPPSF